MPTVGSEAVNPQPGTHEVDEWPLWEGAKAFGQEFFVNELYGGAKALVTGEAGRALGEQSVQMVESRTGQTFTGTASDWMGFTQATTGSIIGTNGIVEGLSGQDLRTMTPINNGLEQARRGLLGFGSFVLSAAGGLGMAAPFTKALPNLSSLARVSFTNPVPQLTASLARLALAVIPKSVQRIASTLNRIGQTPVPNLFRRPLLAPNEVPRPNLGRPLGSGADGSVFEVQGNPNQAIKQFKNPGQVQNELDNLARGMTAEGFGPENVIKVLQRGDGYLVKETVTPGVPNDAQVAEGLKFFKALDKAGRQRLPQWQRHVRLYREQSHSPMDSNRMSDSFDHEQGAIKQLDPTQIAARELLTIAERRGIDLSPLWRDWVFRTEDRMIYFWREGDKYCYALEGASGPQSNVNQLNNFMRESGVIAGIDDAVELLSAWLLDRKDVARLPMRHVASHGNHERGRP